LVRVIFICYFLIGSKIRWIICEGSVLLGKFNFVKDGKPACTIIIGSKNNREDLHSAKILADTVRDIGGVRLEIKEATEEISTQNQVLIGSPENNPLAQEILRADKILVKPEDKLKEKRLLIPEDLGSQGFVIYCSKHADKPSLVLSGYTNQGTFYAVNTLVDRIYKKGKDIIADGFDSEILPIFNMPAFAYRSVATNIGGPDWLGHAQWEKEFGFDYKAFIDWLAGHKINNIIIWTFDLEFGIAYPSEKFPECVNKYHPNVRKEFMGDLIDYAHERYMSVYFFIDFPDNWTTIIRAHPELAGANVDLSALPSSESWWEEFQKTGIQYERWGEYPKRILRLWVCGSKPETMKFWRDYWEELMDRYPNVDGVGGQFCEHETWRCNCENCKEHFFDLQLKYFKEMYQIAKSKNPDIRLWFYDAWGARDIRRYAKKHPGVIYIDWGGNFPIYSLRHAVPRGNWYLYHRGKERWYEFGLKEATQIFNERGQEGMQLRMVYYKELDRMYQAFKEFSWNPKLSIEEYARLYIRKRLRRDEEKVSKAYAHWIKIKGYSELLNYLRLPSFKRKLYEEKMKKEIESLKKLLKEIDVENEFVADLRGAAESFLKNQGE